MPAAALGCWTTSFQSPSRIASLAPRIPTLKKLFQKLHPGEKYYLTNIQAFDLRPDEVRRWKSDLWLFPYYTDEHFVPYDARLGGVATATSPSSRG